MKGRARHLVNFSGLAVAALIVGATPAAGDDATADEPPAKTERPTTLDRPIGVKPYFLSQPPEQLAPSDEQRSIDYHAGLLGVINALSAVRVIDATGASSTGCRPSAANAPA